MSDQYKLDFISQEDFEEHILSTLVKYQGCLESINLQKFNNNIIDPIKLLLDKHVFDKSYDDLITTEIHRQRDRTTVNIIGYFHQNMFKYIKGCEVPKEGWDIIFRNEEQTYYVEMKNKHNTMNSSSASKTYMRMQSHLLNADDRDKCICALVEVIARQSQNNPWVITIDKKPQLEHKQIRRISIDKFYEIVTGNPNAFKNLCDQLPITVKKLIKANRTLSVEKDTVIEELKNLNEDTIQALFKLTFPTYNGFDK